MEREEVRKILTVLRTAYPQSFTNHTKESATMLMDLWYEIFKNTPTALVTLAVKDIIAHDVRDFAPNPGQVNNRIAQLITIPEDEDGEKAWKAVIGAIRSVRKFEGYNSDDAEYNRRVYSFLPDLVRSIYSLSDIYRMSDISSKDLNAYEKPKFLKVYKSVRQNGIQIAMSTGNYAAIANKDKLLALGFEQEQILLLTEGVTADVREF